MPLNHPNICQICDIGPDYLVFEYIAGRPLQGPLATDEALKLAGQISAAVEAAHRSGILHRDLKPANAPLPIWGRVEYHLLCSEIDAAAEWYEMTIEQREPFAAFFANATLTRALRASARWPRLARMMNLDAKPR